ncbi:MAG: hypothetical protein ACOC56_01285 [Atribacterota bacterium]
MRVNTLICYECDHCDRYINKDSDFMIEVRGQWEGRSDMPYEFHFCDIECLKKEYKKQKKISNSRKDNETDEYCWILQKKLLELKKLEMENNKNNEDTIKVKMEKEIEEKMRKRLEFEKRLTNMEKSINNVEKDGAEQVLISISFLKEIISYVERFNFHEEYIMS